MILKVYCKIQAGLKFANFRLGNGKSWKSQSRSYLLTATPKKTVNTLL